MKMSDRFNFFGSPDGKLTRFVKGAVALLAIWAAISLLA